MEEVETNKYGVPYHSYRILLADGEEDEIDVGIEEEWGNVQECGPDDKVKGRWDKAVGWGNDEDGHVEIVRVEDGEDGTVWELGGKRTPLQWALERVWCHAAKYSS